MFYRNMHTGTPHDNFQNLVRTPLNAYKYEQQQQQQILILTSFLCGLGQ